jgi:hypothetical protein
LGWIIKLDKGSILEREVEKQGEKSLAREGFTLTPPFGHGPSNFPSARLDSGILGLEWEGGHGYSVIPPRPYAQWVPGHWRSQPGGWIWVPEEP